MIILEAVHRRDPGAAIVLFGSRADDEAKGGDIDLLILTDRLGFRDIWPIRRDILDRIGWQKLDIVLQRKDEQATPIARIAQESGVRL